MRHMTFLLVGLLLVSLASGCCCWGQGWHNGCGTSPCGPGGCGVQQYGQPLPSGAYVAPVPTQAAYGPVTTYPATIAVQPSLPTYHY